MSYYEDERRQYKGSRDKRRDDYDDMSYDTRNAKAGTIVRRARDESVSSVEEVTRDFPPGERGDGYYRETTVRKSGRRPISRAKSYEDDDYADDRYDDRSVYSRRRRGTRDDDTYVSRRSKRSYDKDDRRSRKYDSYSDSSRSRSPPSKKDKDRRKSTTEDVLKSIGLGGVVGVIPGLLSKDKDKDKSRSRSRDRDSRARSRRRGRSSSSSRSRSRDTKKRGGKERGAEALKAALLAGVVEAVRARNQPGGWGGEKGKRVLTSAISAGGVDGILSHTRGEKDHSTRDIFGSAIAGLATNRIVNGSRSKSRGPATDADGRPVSPDGRGRAQSRGGIGDLAAGGVLGATGKKMWDKVRSRSRGRQPSRGSSADSYDSRSRSQTRPKPERKRSASVSAAAAKGLAALGLTSAADKVDPERRKSQHSPPRYDDRDRGYDDRDRGYDDRGYDRGYDDRRHYDDYSDYDRSGRNGGYRDPNVGTLTHPNAAGPLVGTGGRAVSTGPAHPGGTYRADREPRHTGDPDTDSDSDLGSSSGEEKDMKKSRKKSVLTGALATVATIHAGHSIYQSMEKREARRKALKEGDISPDQARREKNKARLQDAASVGIAALGIKGTYSEWQGLRKHNQEIEEKKETAERHKAKRDARRRKESMLAAEQYRANGYSGSLPNLATNDSPYYGSDGGTFPSTQAQPPQYYDANPYASAYSAPHPQQYSTPPPPPPNQGYPPQYDPRYQPQHPQGQYQEAYDIPPPPIGSGQAPPPRADTR